MNLERFHWLIIVHISLNFIRLNLKFEHITGFKVSKLISGFSANAVQLSTFFLEIASSKGKWNFVLPIWAKYLFLSMEFRASFNLALFQSSYQLLGLNFCWRNYTLGQKYIVQNLFHVFNVFFFWISIHNIVSFFLSSGSNWNYYIFKVLGCSFSIICLFF